MNLYFGVVIGAVIALILDLGVTPAAWVITILGGVIGYIIEKQQDEKKKNNGK
jgi:uncharacterized membrane protein